MHACSGCDCFTATEPDSWVVTCLAVALLLQLAGKPVGILRRLKHDQPVTHLSDVQRGSKVLLVQQLQDT